MQVLTRANLSKHGLVSSASSKRWLFVGDSKGTIYRVPRSGRAKIESKRPRARALRQLRAINERQLILCYSDGQTGLYDWEDGWVQQGAAADVIDIWTDGDSVRVVSKKGSVQTFDANLLPRCKEQKLTATLVASFAPDGSLLLVSKGLIKRFRFDEEHHAKEDRRQVSRGVRPPDFAQHADGWWAVAAGERLTFWNDRTQQSTRESYQQRRVRFHCGDSDGERILLGDHGGQVLLAQGERSASLELNPGIGESIRTVLLAESTAYAGTAKGTLVSISLLRKAL